MPAQMAERAKSQKIRAADWAAEKKVQHWASATITVTRKTHWCQTEVNDNVRKVNRDTEKSLDKLGALATQMRSSTKNLK